MGMLPGEMTVTDNDVLCIAAAAAAASADLITRVQQISMTANPVNGVKVSFTALKHSGAPSRGVTNIIWLLRTSN